MAWGGVLLTGDLWAQSITSVLDPVCRLPQLGLNGATSDDSVLVLRGGDDLASLDQWPAILQLGASVGGHAQHWVDPEARAAQRRFYRLERQPRIPLRPVPNFRLTDHLGVSHELLREGDAKFLLLVFTDNAALNSTWATIRPLQETYASKGVVTWLINPADDRASLAQAAEAAGVTTPVLHDLAQLVSKAFGATTSGEAKLIRMEDFQTVYAGPAEDLCESPNGTLVRQPYLADALASAVANQPVAVERVRTRGTALPIQSETVASYSQAIGPLLLDKCAVCHRPSGIGSWAMTNHTALLEKADRMRENLMEGLMPPWHADPAHQKFANDFSLTPKQQSSLVTWLDAGAPRGEGADPLLSVPAEPASTWPLGEPDIILTIPKQAIPATGQIDYRTPKLTNPFKTNVWVRAATVRADNKAVVHHALVFYSKSGNPELESLGGLGGYFAGYVPGMDQVAFPESTAKLLEAGPKGTFEFQMHYTPNGTATTDQTQMGIYLAKAPPVRALKTTSAFNLLFSIPPGDRGSQFSNEIVISNNVLLHEMSPHMHLRGDRMRFEAIYPDGTSEILLNVPKYDFAWQALYRLAQPKALPAGTHIRLTGGYDNTPYNPFNPDATKQVRFGLQSTEEMFIGYLNVSEAR